MMQDTIETLLAKVNTKLEQGSFFFLSNDPERTLGLEGLIANMHLAYIDKSQLTSLLDNSHINTFCLNDHIDDTEVFRSSLKLIKHQKFVEYFNTNKLEQNYIQTFKISPAFEKAVADLGAHLLNTTGELNRLFENKLSQYEQLSKLAVSLPRTIISTFAETNYEALARQFGNEFVIQFDRGHTGSGTMFINNKEAFNELAAKYPQRTVKFSEMVIGKAYTLNACVLRQGVVMGGLSKQITGVEGLTNLKGATVGNDFSSHQDFTSGKDALIEEVKLIGEQMRASGYLGMFGIDLLVKDDGTHVIIEINARQPASIPMYTKIQLHNKEIPLALLHIAEFLAIDYVIDINKFNETNMMPQNYSQVFVRALKDEVINSEVKMGFYRLQGDNAAIDRVSNEVKENTIFLDEDRDKALLFESSGYDISKEDSPGLIIFAPSLGRKIKMNDEIARMQLQQGAFIDSNNIKPWIIEALKAIRNYQV